MSYHGCYCYILPASEVFQWDYNCKNKRIGGDITRSGPITSIRDGKTGKKKITYLRSHSGFMAEQELNFSFLNSWTIIFP